jgi:hypothetical protein
LEAEHIIHREPQFLFAPEIAFGRLDRAMPEQELDLFEFATGEMTEAAYVRRRSCGASLSMSATRAACFTIFQITFGVMPSPQIVPALLIDRKIRPSVIRLAEVQFSSASFTQTESEPSGCDRPFRVDRLWPGVSSRS